MPKEQQLAKLRAMLAATPSTVTLPSRAEPVPAAPMAWLAGGPVQVPRVGAAWLASYAASDLVPAAARHHEALLTALADAASPLCQRLAAAGLGQAPAASDMLWVDIETTGLRPSEPLFLIGVMTCDERGLRLDQYLARNFREEPAVLALFLQAATRHRHLVSFNGKSFDLPFIAGRCQRLRLGEPPPAPHCDLLHEARASWRHELPNCRLQTLEQHLCGRARHDDVPGGEIPAEYRRWLATGQAGRMPRVLLHNQLDLLTLVELMLHLPPPPPPKTRRRPRAKGLPP